MTRESRKTKKSSSIQTKAITKDADMPGYKIYVWNTYRKFHITDNQWHKDDTLTGSSSVNGLAGAAQRRSEQCRAAKESRARRIKIL